MTADPPHDPFVVTGAQVGVGTPLPPGLPATAIVDVRIADGTITQVGPDLAAPGDRTVDAGGAALVAGLHDHHLHLMAMAAAARSLDVSDCGHDEAFDAAVRSRADDGDATTWLRVVGFDHRHGALDRRRLDRLVPHRPVRVQHASGAAWALNSRAGTLMSLTDTDADGWIFDADQRLRQHWGEEQAPDLTGVGRRLSSLGVTGVTDATPSVDGADLAVLAEARRANALPQRVVAMGGVALAGAAFPGGLDRGPVKIVIGDHQLPTPAELVTAFGSARAAGRNVAVHCVTRVALVLALTVWTEVGAAPGDRIEHGSVIPVEMLATVGELGLTVVTQPGFIHARGDRYLSHVDADDVGHLYRCGSLLDAGIGVGGSTDAPFGPDDPWLAIATMGSRATSGGRVVGAAEAITTEVALGRFLSHPTDPGGPPRLVRPGAPADLVLLGGPLEAVLADPLSTPVAATWIGGSVVHGDPGC